MEHRLRRFKSRMKREGLTGFLVTDLRNIRYLTGFTGSSAVLFVGRRPHFFTDFRYQEQSKQEVTPKAVIHIIKRSYPEELASLSKLKGVERMGFEAGAITVASLANFKKKMGKAARLKWVPTKGLIEELRLVKDSDEIELIAKAARITDKTFAEVLALVKPGVSERDLAAEIVYRFQRRTGLPPAFPSIVASGPNSALPHAKPTTRKLRKGDFVTFDIGCQWKGYASDFTRTVVIGKATAKHKEIYAVVREAHRRALDGIRAGVSCKAADALARDYITDKGYGEQFGHSLGHGVGLNVHEAPRLSALSKEKLRPGSVVTVEPGVYLPGWGGVRIEDLVLVTKEGVRILSATPREKLLEL